MISIQNDDITYIANYSLKWELLRNKTILISGGTGFIGSLLCDVILYRNRVYGDNIHVICLSLSDKPSNEYIRYINHNVTQPLSIDGDVDYIIHMASNTHPLQYKTDPIGTITGNVFGSFNLLEVAREKNIKRFLLASSCEIYGDTSDTPVDENYCGYINCNTARAGYNESKRVSESLCQSYKEQYGIDCCIFRLARVLGCDKTKNDTKAMSQFIRNGVNGENIVLHSPGKQKFSYVYVADAVLGILTVLLNGKSGEAYNISADNGNETLYDYASYIANLSNVSLKVDIQNDSFASKSSNSLLDNSKIKQIGFKPRFSVKEGIARTLEIYKKPE